MINIIKLIIIASIFVLQTNIVVASPPNGKWKLVFWDDFNGTTIDTSKWDVENYSPNHIISSRWAENIIVKDGICRLVTKRENRGGKEWTSAHFWSKNYAPQYGYFEAKIKYAGATGLNNAFWLMPVPLNGSIDFEIDINEGKYPDKIDTNVHSWKGQVWDKQLAIKANADLSKDFHIYGLEWNRENILWYFDGKEVRREINTFNSGGANIRFSTAVMQYLNPTNELDMKSMDIDYIYVYQPDNTTFPIPSSIKTKKH